MNHNTREIHDPKLKEQLDGIDFSNAKPFKDVIEELEYEMANRSWYKKAWDWIWFKTFYHLTPTQLQWYKTQVECYFHRGKHGWSYMDTWGYDRYLAQVISGGVKNIRKNTYGHPCDCEEEQWNDILDKIAFTFDLAIRVHEEDLILLLREDFDNEENFLAQKERYIKLSKENPDFWKIVSDEDTVKYKEGWRLFERYFFSLWV